MLAKHSTSMHRQPNAVPGKHCGSSQHAIVKAMRDSPRMPTSLAFLLLQAFMATLYWCCASRVEPESYWHHRVASSSDSSDDDSDSAVSEPAGETTALLGKKRKDVHYSSL